MRPVRLLGLALLLVWGGVLGFGLSAWAALRWAHGRLVRQEGERLLRPVSVREAEDGRGTDDRSQGAFGDDRIVQEAVRKGERSFVVVSRPEGRWVVAVVPGEGRPRVVAQDLAELDRTFRRLERGMWAVVLGMMVLASWSVLGWGRRLGAMVDGARSGLRKIAEGDLSVRLPSVGRGPLRGLVADFNEAMERVEFSYGSLASEQAKARRALMSMNEGLLVVNGEGRVLLSNPAFERLTGGEVSAGEPFWSVVREPALFELFDRIRGSGRPETAELRLARKTILCLAEPLEASGEYLFLFRDVDLMKNIETIKRSLVANVSHELKTPLTSIKGFAEFLLEGERDRKKRHYLEVIVRNVDRLIAIVTDLLDLSRLEERPESVLKVRTDVAGICRKVVSDLGPKASKKGLMLEFEGEGEGVWVVGDAYLLEQLLVNLVDNGLKYTDAGRVAVRAFRGAGEAVVEVEDTGIGIPEEHQERIFERFYVVDKSRSRQSGGTGLGLSIVKHIVLIHGGRIAVRSRPGFGSVFRVSLPLAESEVGREQVVDVGQA